MAARWLFLRCRVDPWADVRYFSGLMLGGVFVLGFIWRRDYPADDPLWPGAGGEFGIVVLNRFLGWWHDPNF